MPKFKSINNNFTSGVISKTLAARTDFPRVQNGLESINNYKVMPQGGLTLRPGTKFSVETKDSSKDSILVDFNSGVANNYCLEFGDLYMRVHKTGGVVVEADQSITNITQADPAVVTYSGADSYTAGDQVYLTDVLGMTEVNDSRLYYTVGTVDTGANTFTLKDRDGVDIDSTAFTAYSSAGTINKIFTLTTIYPEADLRGLSFEQNKDTLTVTHNSYSPRDFKRSSDLVWTITSYMKDAAESSTTLILNNGPYQSLNTTDTPLTPSGGSYAIGDTFTMTAEFVTGINNDTGFQTTDVGRLIRMKNTSSEFAWGEIVSRVSTTVVTVTTFGNIFTATAGTEWQLGAWSDTTGFPKYSTYYQSRQWFFNTTEELDRIDGSVIEDFLNFRPSADLGGVDDNDAIDIKVGGTNINAIYWAVGSGDRLRIGTAFAVWSLWGGSDNKSITPTNKQVRKEDRIQCKSVKPVDLGNITLFADSSGKKLQELSFSIQSNSLLNRDLTILSDEILGDVGDTTDTGVTKLVYQQFPYDYIWCLKNDGTLAGITYARNEDVFGWSSHNIGGSSVTVQDIGSIFSATETEVLMIVKRTINGITRRYVEKLDTTFRGRAAEDSIFSDCSITVTGTALAAGLTLSAVSGSGVTVTADAAIFAATDIGKVIGSGTGKGIITGYTSTTVVTINAGDTFASTSIASGAWTMSINSISGLEYLEGETVRILANGGQRPDKVVTSGTVALGGEYNKVILGLDHSKNFKSLNKESGSPLGTSIGSRLKVTDIYISYFETVGGEVGIDSTDRDSIFMRTGTSEGGKGIEPQTGISEGKPPGGWNDTSTVYYNQPNNLPSTILAMTTKGEVND